MANVTFTEVRGDEVYVYVRGVLVMKRWLRTGRSVTFHVAPSGVRWNDPPTETMGKDNGDGS